MTSTARGTFTIEMTPAARELAGAVQRFEFRKLFDGDLSGTGAGLMLSVGNPQDGAAGYVALETVRGKLGDRRGGFALGQLGTMHSGSQTLNYVIVPGSGSEELRGIIGSLELAVDDDGTHRYTLSYEL